MHPFYICTLVLMQVLRAGRGQAAWHESQALPMEPSSIQTSHHWLNVKCINMSVLSTVTLWHHSVQRMLENGMPFYSQHLAYN